MPNRTTAVEEWIVSDQTTRDVEKARSGPASVIAELSAILGYDVYSINSLTDESTTAAIRHDPIWNQRLTASFEAARAGRTRPIDEYWNESDAEDG